ncbi:MAG: ATP-binding protein, partial [Defluviitaleaceae bacterium]|nr:ATP-binding protein [Defluviitaleaceae bacterium]
GDIPYKTREYLSNIHEGAEWLLKIIDDILDISKIESGKIVLEHIPFDIHDIIVQCRAVIYPRAAEKGIALQCETESAIGGKLIGDPLRLRQALLNLLSNAVKFTDNGSVVLDISVAESTESDTSLHFSIKDSGIGMTPEQIANIFVPYMQGDESIARKYGGTGLGIPITKKIIELMGGSLITESVPGKGSTFSFTIKFNKSAKNETMSAKYSKSSVVEKPNFTGDVLVCEDNYLNLQVICEHLLWVGIKAVVARNGKEGYEIVAKRVENGEKPFDLIYMDIHMPVMDGMEAASKITALGVKTPIVAVTANVMSSDLKSYKENGMADCLAKPFSSQELWSSLKKYLTVKNVTVTGKRQLAGFNDAMLDSFKKHFVNDNQNTYDEITEALKNGDMRMARILVHTLKGNSGQIEEQKLREAAIEVEKAILEEKRENIGFLMANMQKELLIVLEKLAPMLDKDASEAKTVKNADIEQMRKIFEKLEPMLINRNPECEGMLDELKTIQGTDELAQHINKFKFKPALEELAKLKIQWGL